MQMLSFEADKTIVMRQTAAMFNINATMDTRDPTGAVANQIYDSSNRQLVQAAVIGIHEDAMSTTMHAPTLPWCRFRRMVDDSAKAMFCHEETRRIATNTAAKQCRRKER